MNRIVRENYAVADLPEDLRDGFATDAEVRVVIEPASPMPEKVLSIDELFALRRPPYKTTEEIVQQVRRMRDEWDD